MCIRDSQCRCVRLDKIKIPFISPLLGVVADVFKVALPRSTWGPLHLSRWGFLPRMHLVTARLGSGANAVVAERWGYRGDNLHAAYDTRQVVRSDYPYGTHAVMWRAPAPAPSAWSVMRAWWAGPARPALRPKPARLVELARVDRDAAWSLAADLARVPSAANSPDLITDKRLLRWVGPAPSLEREGEALGVSGAQPLMFGQARP